MQPETVKKVKIQLMVTRHGETDHNKKKILCGQNPGKLTEEGKLQAQMIGNHLKEKQFDKIYVSDLGRTKETFENIKLKASHLNNIETKYESLLREKSGGVLTGQPLSIWQKQARKQRKNIREYKCKDGQSWIDVNTRVHKFIEKCVKENILQIENPKMEQKMLVVCHGGYIMEFHNVFQEISSRGKEKPVFSNSAKNCSIHVFELQYSLNQKGRQYSQQHLQIKCTVNNFTDHLLQK